MIIFFFFKDPATTEIYPLSLHDALPIWWRVRAGDVRRIDHRQGPGHDLSRRPAAGEGGDRRGGDARRSEEHTSELQSPCNLVCRLLLEKKQASSLRPSQQRRFSNTSVYR